MNTPSRFAEGVFILFSPELDEKLMFFTPMCIYMGSHVHFYRSKITPTCKCIKNTRVKYDVLYKLNVYLDI